MGVLLLVGVSTARELSRDIGHMACTLGGVNYESRGHRGALKGSAARGAANPLFRHHAHRLLTDVEAKQAKDYADGCIGQPYVFGGIPSDRHGGDCSGFVSGIICAADGREPHRLFGTSTWAGVSAGLGFADGLGGGGAPTGDPIGIPDRPFPGFPIARGSDKRDHVKWIQARLDFAGGGHHAVLQGRALGVDGTFGDDTEKVVVAFQKAHGLQGLGMVGPKTWPLLNAIR